MCNLDSFLTCLDVPNEKKKSGSHFTHHVEPHHFSFNKASNSVVLLMGFQELHGSHFTHNVEAITCLQQSYVRKV